MKQRIYIIAGPTASGKTAAAIGVAKRMNAEIVSADSIQIYRGLDIRLCKAIRSGTMRRSAPSD